MTESPKIHPLGDNCVTVDFGNAISLDLNSKAVRLAAHFENSPFPGFIESVPAYSSVSIFYSPVKVHRSFPDTKSAFDAIRDLVTIGLQSSDETADRQSNLVEI